MLFKFKADLCYHKQQYDDAIGWYKMVLKHLPKTNGQVHSYSYTSRLQVDTNGCHFPVQSVIHFSGQSN